MSDNPKIQLLGLREGKGTVFYNKNIRALSVPELFLRCQDYVDQFEEEERFNLHYTLAHFNEGTKARQEFVRLEVIAIDVDGIDMTKLDLYLNLVIEILNLDATKTGIVASGNGLHFIMKLDDPIVDLGDFKKYKLNYKAMCDSINDVFEKQNLPGNADPVIFEAKRTLRLPLTKNIKPNKGTKNCQLLQAVIEEQGFKLENYSSTAQLQRELPDRVRFASATDSKAVQKGCEFLKLCKADPNKLSEPEWFAMIGILGNLENGKELIHDYSSKYFSYTMVETDRKINHVISNAEGPTLCSRVDTLSDSCKTCKYNGKITTPLQIKGPDFIKTKDTFFHEIRITEEGKIKYGRPCYPDLFKQWKSEYKHISINGNIYVYKDTYWVEMPRDFILNWAAKKFEDHAGVAKVKEFYEGWVVIKNLRMPDFFDRKKPLMNCKNGVLNFENLEFYAHDPKFGFTYCLEYDYDVDAKCPVWDKVLMDVTQERKDLVELLEEYFGYAFSNSKMKWHKCLVLLGDGSNGKSTILQTLKQLAGIGNGCSTLNLSEINGEYNRMRLVGKLFNVSEETPKKSLSDSSLFKSLVGGESYTARNPYGKPIEVKENRCKLIMAANTLPFNNDTSSGFFRRLMIIPFDRTFSPEEADYQIHEKLELELSGILNRLIQGYQALMLRGRFTDPESSRHISQEYFYESNPIAEWSRQNIVIDGAGSLKSKTAYESYKSWCEENNIPRHLIPTGNVFSRAFNKVCKSAISYRSPEWRGYKGVRLISDNAHF